MGEFDEKRISGICIGEVRGVLEVVRLGACAGDRSNEVLPFYFWRW